MSDVVVLRNAAKASLVLRPVVYNQCSRRQIHSRTWRNRLAWKRQFLSPEDRASSVPTLSCNGSRRKELPWSTSISSPTLGTHATCSPLFLICGIVLLWEIYVTVTSYAS